MISWWSVFADVTSADAAEYPRKHGYDAKTMEEGMNGWGRVHVAYPTNVGDVMASRPFT